MDVHPVTPDQFGLFLPLLTGFGNNAMEPEDWRRMLFDLPWRVEEPHRGYGLFKDARPVGFLGTIFSTRIVRGSPARFCNLSSWIVEPAHRSRSMQLLLPILAMKAHTIVNLTASEQAHEIFRSLQFRTLEDHQILVPLLPNAHELVRRPRGRALTNPERLRAALSSRERTIFDDMRETRAGHVLVHRGDRSCYVVATRSPWKGPLRLAYVHYASDWDMFWTELPLVSFSFFRALGTSGLRVDGRRVRGEQPALARRRKLPLPTLYRPAGDDVTPDQVDGLYTELVQQPW